MRERSELLLDRTKSQVHPHSHGVSTSESHLATFVLEVAWVVVVDVDSVVA